MGLFGGGNSSSSQLTTNVDARVVGGEQSINTSLNVTGSNNAITTTDHGAIQGALSLALAGVEDANQTASQVVASQGHILDGVLKLVGDQSSQHAANLAKLKSGDSRLIVIAGFAVAGAALLALIKKG